jgi:hypothetical protein
MKKRVPETRKHVSNFKFAFIIVLLCLLAKPHQLLSLDDEVLLPVSSHSSTLEDINASDVLARLDLVRDEVDLIRFEMGKPASTETRIQLSQATAIEAYFQAVTLYRKTRRLAFERTGDLADEPKLVKTNQIKSFHVWQLVNQSLERLLFIKEKLRIEEVNYEKVRTGTSSSSNVFQVILKLNRQLDELLEQKFESSEVYQEVTHAIGYASRLLARFPDSKRIPDPPILERGKKPSDVFQKLMTSYELIQEIAGQSGLQIVKFEVDKAEASKANSGDSYNLISLIVSELAWLHSKLENAAPPPGSYFPGYRFPSHTFQRVGILEAQLSLLKGFVSEHPDWLVSEGNFVHA